MILERRSQAEHEEKMGRKLMEGRWEGDEVGFRHRTSASPSVRIRGHCPSPNNKGDRSSLARAGSLRRSLAARSSPPSSSSAAMTARRTDRRTGADRRENRGREMRPNMATDDAGDGERRRRRRRRATVTLRGQTWEDRPTPLLREDKTQGKTTGLSASALCSACPAS